MRVTRMGLGVILLMASFAPDVGAYSPTTAAAYADSNYNRHPPRGASGCGTDMGECYFDHQNDCANFVSAVLHEAGYDFHGTGAAAATLADVTKWYSRWSDLYGMVVTTQTWSYADNLYRFLMADTPGGSLVAIRDGWSLLLGSGGGTGDVLFYDWDQISEQRPKDHTSIIVAYGDDPNTNYYGDLVDQQTTDRYHAFWTLRQHNPQWDTTKIYVVDVSTSN